MRLKGTRRTKETGIEIDLAPGGEPEVSISWAHHGGLDEPIDEGLATHFMHTLVRYMRLGGSLTATGDLAHHVIEDTAITLGGLLREASEAGAIVRFADRTVAMDEALVQVVLDAGGRPFCSSDVTAVSELWHHVIRSLAFEAKFTVHVLVHRGADPHHVVEATLKGLGLCLADALSPSDRLESTKGEPERS